MDQDSNNKIKTITDDAKIDKDAAFSNGTIKGTLGLLSPFVGADDIQNTPPLHPTLNQIISQLGTRIDDNHFKVGPYFVTVNSDGTVNIIPLNSVADSKIKSKLNQDEDQRIKDTLK